MLIDFRPVFEKQIPLTEFSQQFSVMELRAAANASIDFLRSIIEQATDAQVAFEPRDDKANDPYAVVGEEQIGWSLGHLVAHVTASSEESAAVASILARGITYPEEPRLRYETPWREVDTQAKALTRLEESRRMRLGYLDTFPDQPFFDVTQELGERARAYFGDMNAKTRFLSGLYHEWQHYDQFREVLAQAQSVLPQSG